ncbi:MAG: hypothetical protein ACFB21_04415 [Opitutales bacterium]
MKRLIIASIIVLLIVTVLNFAGFFSPGFNPDGYRGDVVSIAWRDPSGAVTVLRQSDHAVRQTETDGGARRVERIPLRWQPPSFAENFILNESNGYRDISVSVDDRWTSISAKSRTGDHLRFLIRNELILEIQVK